MGRKPNNVSTSPDLKNDQVKVEDNNVDTTPVTDNVDTTPDAGEKSENDKAKKITFEDDKEYEIISKIRAGKKITANTSDVISFDDKGKATVKGTVARYLIGSGLGFELAK